MSSRRVLIADADAALADCYRRHLTSEGYEVAVAADAPACLERLRSFSPHVLVLDPELPAGSGSGDEVLAAMYSQDDIPTVPVVILAEGRDLEALYRAAAWPVGEWHDKPCEPPLLAATIGHVLAERPRSARRRERAGTQSTATAR